MSGAPSSPAGRWRCAVRGFSASMWRSISRFADIPSVRAPTIATVIHRNAPHDGSPSAASTMPVYANGSANTVSWTRTAPGKSRSRRNSGRGSFTPISRTRPTWSSPAP